MTEKNKDNKIDEVQEDNFTGLDEGLAGSSEDAYDGDYTIQSVRLGSKIMNKRIGTFTAKTEADKNKDTEENELPSLDEKLAEAEEKFNAQFQSNKAKEIKEFEK